MVRVAVTDVADEEQLRAAAALAIADFGRIDTWVNNAGISIFGYHKQISREDQHRVFETNF